MWMPLFSSTICGRHRLPALCVLDSLGKDQQIVNSLIYFWASSSVPLVYVLVSLFSYFKDTHQHMLIVQINGIQHGILRQIPSSLPLLFLWYLLTAIWNTFLNKSCCSDYYSQEFASNQDVCCCSWSILISLESVFCDFFVNFRNFNYKECHWRNCKYFETICEATIIFLKFKFIWDIMSTSLLNPGILSPLKPCRLHVMSLYLWDHTCIST